jgi:hypothetical protein
MPFLVNVVTVALGLVITMAAFIYFRFKGGTVAEAAAYGLMAMLMIVSWIAQVLLVCGLQRFMLPTLLLAALPAFRILIRHRRLLWQQGLILASFSRSYTLPALVFICTGICILGFSIWNEISRGPITFKGLCPVLAQERGALFVLLQSKPLIGAVALNHIIFMADWQPLVLAPLANCWAYAAIALATYALARRYAWPLTAITATCLIISMPRLVHQNLATQSELLPAAAALLVILALFRTVENPKAEDLTMLVVAIAFSVSEGLLCYLMPLVLAALSLVVLARRHSLSLGVQSMQGHPGYVWVGLVAAVVFSQLIGIAGNLFHGLPWMGVLAPSRVVYNSDGLIGAGANMVRYLFQTVHLPVFFDDAVQFVFGWRLVDVMDLLYHRLTAAWIGGRGAAQGFHLNWAPDNPWTWYGPVGFLLVVPAMVQALWMGPRRLKTTALAMSVYWLLVALIAAWQFSNVRLLTPMFVCSGFFIAFFLPPWRIGRRGAKGLQWFSLAMVVYALLTYPGHRMF